MRIIASTALAVGLMSAAFSGGAFAQGKTIRICDASGCNDRPAGYIAPDPAEKLKAVREDRDTYRGEPISQLEGDFRAGNAVAAYKLGMIAQYGVGGSPINEARAASYYESAAAQNHTWAKYRLATLLTSGRSVPRNSARALELFFSAANDGQPQSANNVGVAYYRGENLPKNPVEALRWLTIAAEAGIAEAQANIGAIYLRGEAGSKNLWEGFKWTKKAADAGQISAQKVLGRIYMTGLSNIQKNINEASRYLSVVANSGDKEAQQWMSEIRAIQAQQQEDARRAQEQAAETFKFLAGVAISTLLAPPPTYVLVR